MEELETAIEGIVINGVDIIKFSDESPPIREIESVMELQRTDGRE